MMEKRVILFQGDSITDGARGRTDDPNHILGHSYAYIVGARLSFVWAEQQPLIINRGISGDRASDLYARWNEDAISLNPDIISILVGVNDAWRSMNGEASGITDRYERAYRHILEETKQVLPEAQLVLCEPFILNTGAPSQNWQAWSERITAYRHTVRELAGQFGAIFVPLQAAFDEACTRADASYWLWDGVHPTAAGHELIARKWLETVLDKEAAGE
ncbi:SGNH/GDSL hydrolase family protein [Paenibacillus sp. 2TAB23]|uniref:SGNH/GDSL hydrolase family protein n=1 Tax=Paenibacillus sp. 2TAB23 TaxID=3233004 RepID=UPI003F9E591B